MKINIRYILGLLSSVLLSAGFVRAAERLDPVSHLASEVSFGETRDDPGTPCQYLEHGPTSPCAFLDRNA